MSCAGVGGYACEGFERRGEGSTFNCKSYVVCGGVRGGIVGTVEGQESLKLISPSHLCNLLGRAAPSTGGPYSLITRYKGPDRHTTQSNRTSNIHHGTTIKDYNKIDSYNNTINTDNQDKINTYNRIIQDTNKTTIKRYNQKKTTIRHKQRYNKNNDNNTRIQRYNRIQQL